MLKKLKISQLPLLISLIIYLLLTLPAIFDIDHTMLNLEPYPDGILYSLQSQINSSSPYYQSLEKSWQQPLYSFYLQVWKMTIGGNFFFYYANIFLGCLSIYICFKAIQELTNSTFSRSISILLLSINPAFLWLTSLPMSENLALLLVSLIVYFHSKKTSLRLFLSHLFISFLLLLTRYALAPLAIISLFAYSLKSKRVILAFVFFTFVSISLYFRTIYQFTINLFSNGHYFGFKYFLTDVRFYSNILSSVPGKFLWLKESLIPFGLPFTIIVATIISSRLRKKLAKWLFLLLSGLVINLLFYDKDIRYVLPLIPIVYALFASSLAELLPNKNSLALLIPLIILFSLAQQAGFYKLVIANNLFFKSSGWQYEAVKQVSNSLNNSDILITALPPQLFQHYSTKEIIILPISQSQEFVANNTINWPIINVENSLLNQYSRLIDSKSNIYITNAYLSHSRDVENDYIQLTQSFNLELIQSGCLETCNLYKVGHK